MKITLGGRDFELQGKLNANDLAEASDKGLDLLSMQPNQKLTIKQMRTFVWLVVRKVDSEVTEEWVGENLDLDNLQEVLAVATNFITPPQKLTQETGSDISTSSEESTDGTPVT